MLRGKTKIAAVMDEIAWEGKDLKPMRSISVKEILKDPYLSKLGKEIIFID